MKLLLTYLVQREVEVKTDEELDKIRETFEDDLAAKGWTTDLEDESEL